MAIFAKISQKLDKVHQNQYLKRSTSVENVRQIGLFLQIFRPGSRRDKANFSKAKIIVSSFVTSE
ncbi:MAG: hypothetical protein A2167_02030 [Planctomycetes bacterium RBG_13_46_10]|nr:MAG: hypothetical protein A2167_02030 [Planctomycetes bacterium RBG_13_46_10]